ncbi:MAG: protein prkA [Actinomycetia bacterium]|nr:protein prkA [Actinomycetes bacterium]
MLDRLQAYVTQEATLRWEGSLADYLEIVRRDPVVTRLAHARLYDMIRAAGVEETPEGPRYRFFADKIIGLDVVLRQIMEYLAGAAQRLDVRKRVLLLIGPPGSAKSTLVIHLKRGLEQYTRTDAGALYGIVGCPLHEEPLHLIPHALREEVAQELGIPPIEGELCPRCAQRWQDPAEWGGDFGKVRVERILFSERDRVGIGTFTPGDPKDLDTAMLVGSLDFSKIAQYGSESDPRAYRFDGELMIANRGLMEEQEWLKQPKDFMALILTLAQERNIKTPRYSLIYADEVVIAHSNLHEYEKFIANPEFEAMKNRTFVVTVPYVLRVDDEEAIYRLMLREGAPQGHLAPHTLTMAAWFTVLSRLEDPKDQSLTLVDKLRLYNGERIKEVTDHQLQELRKQHPREGLSGLSPRDALNVLAHAQGMSGVPCVNPVDYLRAAKQFVEEGRFLIMAGAEQQKRLLDLLTKTREEYDRRVKETVMRAFVHAFESAAQTLFEAYLQHAEADLEKQKVPDPVTGEPRDPDTKFLREIEGHVGVGETAAKAFREEMLRKAGSAARRGEVFRWDSHPRLKEGIEKRLFADVRTLVKGTLGTKTPDPEQQEKLQQVTQHLKEREGYCDHCAQALLTYAGILLAREGQ